MGKNIRTANRNIVFLYQFAENINTDPDIIQAAIQRTGTPKEIDAFFDRFTIAFGKWLLRLSDRAKEHPMEEILEMYREYISSSPDDEQIDYEKQESRVLKSDPYSTHAPCGCPM